MAQLDVNPLVLKDALVQVGADDFRKHVSGVTFTPSSSQQSWTGLGANTHTDSSTPSWTVQLDYVQDWMSTESLSRYLYEHEGETVTMTFGPLDGDGPTFTASVSIVSGAIGGQVNAFATTSVTLGCDRPTLVEAA